MEGCNPACQTVRRLTADFDRAFARLLDQATRVLGPGRVHEDALRILAESIAPERLEQAIDAEHGADLSIAASAARGDAFAIARVDELLSSLRSSLEKLDRRTNFVDEVLQEVRIHLLVPENGESARILRYDGRGALRGFLRIVSVRIALTLLRQAANEVSLEDALLDAQSASKSASDPKARNALRRALEEAIVALDPADRTLLRLHVINGLGIDRLAELQGVHRATAARRVRAIHERISNFTKARFAEMVGLGESEDVESLIRALQSQLDPSFERILAS
jgi:RNA polymerase sigma-70 factor (ECF subfamily)